jgi:hypothetical protein
MNQLKETLLELIKYTGIQITPNQPLDILEVLNELKDRQLLSIREVAAITERIKN